MVHDARRLLQVTLDAAPRRRRDRDVPLAPRLLAAPDHFHRLDEQQRRQKDAAQDLSLIHI